MYIILLSIVITRFGLGDVFSLAMIVIVTVIVIVVFVVVLVIIVIIFIVVVVVFHRLFLCQHIFKQLTVCSLLRHLMSTVRLWRS